jgi:ATP-dependent RNA circularization protein (DNA/RNA ligase family)
MTDQEEPLLEPIEEIEEIEDEESIVDDLDLDLEMPDDDDDDEEYMMDMGGLLSSVLATEDGDTVCSALVNISRQMEVQNKILIKMLSHMQKINLEK